MTEETKPRKSRTKTEDSSPTIAHDSVVSGGDTDPIRYSSAKPSHQKRVLTVLHIQRRLVDLGFNDAGSSLGGNYDALTRSAVSGYQDSRGEEPTGVLTREQFSDLFAGDPNVDVSVDTHEDHGV